MNKSLILVWHLLVTLAKLLKPGGTRAVIAENILMRQQLIIMTRYQNRSPKLSPSDKFLFGYLSLYLKHSRLLKLAITLKPSTLLRLHKVLVKGKYSALFSSAMTPRKPGPKGPSKKLITAIVEMKQRNPRFGCPKIALQISNVFGVELNKEVVRRVLANHYRPASGEDGPSWLTILGHTKDSLWSRNAGPIDLFRCESINLKSHWVLLVLDQFTRRIVGFGVHAGDVDGPTLCRIFNSAITKQNLPNYLSSDNDPLFRYHPWKANLRILEIEEIKSIPYLPISHPFVERLTGTIRREFLDNTLFWNASDLEKKLGEFQKFYNHHRAHSSLGRETPSDFSKFPTKKLTNLQKYTWLTFCRGLFQLPVGV